MNETNYERRILMKKAAGKSWLLAPILAVFFLAGCAAKTASVNIWGNPEKGLILTYRIPADQALAYESSSDSTEVSEVMGQTVEVLTDGSSKYGFRTVGEPEGNLRLEVTLDGMSLDISSPQGSINPDMSGLIGKSFNMTLSPQGKELDTSEAAKLEYELTAGQTRNLQSGFQTLFPDLPSRPVKVGDSWPSYATIEEKSDTNAVKIEMELENTLVGIETVDGFECAKIESIISGTVTGEGTQQGMNLATSGELKGKDTWYFAYVEGYLLKIVSEVEVDASIEVTGPTNLTIPTTRVINMEMLLVK
jgi:hypothetical protein